MFKITEGIVAILILAGLDEPPEAEGFSTNIANSYFSQDGVDVSLTWMASDLHAKMMQQHRENLTSPELATVDRISDVMLGGEPVTEIVYYKSLPVPDFENPGEIIEGREATWQYTWPGDDGASHALLTIWRSGTDEIDALEGGFAAMRDRWQAGSSLPGTLYALRAERQADRLVLTGVAVEAPDVPWGSIRVPAFHGYEEWSVMVDPPKISEVRVPKPILFEIPGLPVDDKLDADVAYVEDWVSTWSPVFGNVGTHIDAAGVAFRDALSAADALSQADGPLELIDALVDGETGNMRFEFRIQRSDGGTHEGRVMLTPEGSINNTEVYW